MTTLLIIKLSESDPAMTHGFRYNVQIWTKDSGHGWCYAGNGKFLKFQFTPLHERQQGKNINRKCGDANVRKRHEIQKAV